MRLKRPVSLVWSRGEDNAHDRFRPPAHARLRAPANCTYLVGVAQSLELADGAFDLVVSTLALHHVPEEARAAAVAEMFRVLRPGGRLLIAEYRPPANPLLDDPGWGAFNLWRGGVPVEPNATICPNTMAALSLAPIPVIPGRSPMAIFSRLTPGTHIRPHHGMLNTRLICHLPLIAPDGCALRVGSETRPWRDGRMLIFDDSFEHEAWNRGTETRIVLLFEVWRPELTIDERAALTDIFEAIDTYQGVAIDTG